MKVVRISGQGLTGMERVKLARGVIGPDVGWPGPGRQPGVYRGAGAGVCQAVEEYDIAWYEEPCTVWITLAIVTWQSNAPSLYPQGEFL